MIRKTYGVSGMMDWTTQIKAGKGAVSVHFTGGALTAYGVTPAKFSTSNPFFQNVIENSDQFKSGRIELLSEMEVADDAAEKARKARMAARIAETPVVEKQPTAQNASPTGSEAPVTEANDTTAEPTDVADDEQPTGDEGESGSNKVEVADKNEAIEYLKEHFADKNYTATSLRTKTAFEAACKECGVEFVFTA